MLLTKNHWKLFVGFIGNKNVSKIGRWSTFHEYEIFSYTFVQSISRSLSFFRIILNETFSVFFAFPIKRWTKKRWCIGWKRRKSWYSETQYEDVKNINVFHFCPFNYTIVLIERRKTAVQKASAGPLMSLSKIFGSSNHECNSIFK